MTVTLSRWDLKRIIRLLEYARQATNTRAAIAPRVTDEQRRERAKMYREAAFAESYWKQFDSLLRSWIARGPAPQVVERPQPRFTHEEILKTLIDASVESMEQVATMLMLHPVEDERTIKALCLVTGMMTGAIVKRLEEPRDAQIRA